MAEELTNSNIARLIQELKLNNYDELYQWSINNREEFWETMINKLNIQFNRPYYEILNLDQGVEKPKWLVGAWYNIVDSCLSKNSDLESGLDFNDASTAIIYQKPGLEIGSISYSSLEALVNRIAHSLIDWGYSKDDHIAICMPMTLEAVAIYLAIVKLGMVVVSIADSFAADEIRTRLELTDTKAIFTQAYIERNDKTLPLYEKIKQVSKVQTIVIEGEIQLDDNDLNWQEFLSEDSILESNVVGPDQHSNILFSSGTTGEPKAIPWTHTTPIKCASDAYLHHNIQPHDVLAWPTNLGWMMGPWLIYAALINRASIALYYDAPTSDGFTKFVEEAGVTMLGVVPSLVRNWRANNSIHNCNWSKIKVLSSTGECSNPEEMAYLMQAAGSKPIIEYCGGTEIGGGYITSTVVQDNYPSQFSTPALGLSLQILDEQGRESNNGEVFIEGPSIGLSNELLNRDHYETYYSNTPKPGLRRHGDQIERLANGYYRAHGRTDDTMNIGGIKVSAAEIEELINNLDPVEECAATSSNNSGPDELIIHIVSQSQPDKQELLKLVNTIIKDKFNPLIKVSDIVLINSLPRTASNKIIRRNLR